MEKDMTEDWAKEFWDAKRATAIREMEKRNKADRAMRDEYLRRKAR